MAKKLFTSALIVVAIMCCNQMALAKELLAFPNAEGFGAESRGGRNGRIMEVCNLNSNGLGSFREACSSKGPRIVIFRTGGILELRKPIVITSPFITIAGQTAPGDGICLKGAGIFISTHDVTIRGLRVRVGDAPDGPDPNNRDGITIASKKPNSVYNIIVDHCSISWSIDENISTCYPCHDITFQWCIISEALNMSLHKKGPHSKGMLIGDHSKRISIHHNLFAHNYRRNPLLKGDTESEVLNNVMYNWGTACINFSDSLGVGPHRSNIVANYCIPGPQSSKGKIIRFSRNIDPKTELYVKCNVDISRKHVKITEDNWQMVEGDSIRKYQSTKPLFSPSGVSIHKPEEAYNMVIKNAGAITPGHDLVDMRVISSAMNRAGSIINSQYEVGGWPKFAHGNPPLDNDHDGIPDKWEIANNLNPYDPDDRNTISSTGYPYIEDYLNSLIEPPILKH